MRRTEQLQGLRLMKFEDVYGRAYRGELSQGEAAEILGMSERTFRRYRDRFEVEGAEGLYDRRLGRVSARRAGVDEVMAGMMQQTNDISQEELEADNFVCRLTLQYLFPHLVAAGGQQNLETVKQQVINAISRIEPATEYAEAGESQKQLIFIRAVLLFHEIAEATRASGTIYNPPTTH